MPNSIRLLLIPLGLYVWQLSLLTVLRLALDSQPYLYFEEAGSSFLDVLYFEQRLQVCQVTSNIASYLLFWLGLHLIPDAGIFYGRLVKTIVMAAIPLLCYLILHRRLQRPVLFSVLASVAVGLLPGVFYFSVFALDMAMDVPFGLLAIYLALGSGRASAIGAGFWLAFAALCYGSGLAFGPPVLYLLWRCQRGWEALALASLTGIALTTAAAFYWTNTQVLFLGNGSGGGYFISGMRMLGIELFRRGVSYYYTIQGLPALGIFPVGLLAIAGVAAGIVRFRVYGVWVLLALFSGLLASASGVPLGVRRAVPLLVALGVLGAAALWELPWRAVRIGAALVCLAVLGAGAVQVERTWRLGGWIRPDYEFPQTQPGLDASIEDYKLRMAPVPPPEPRFGMRMTYAILYLLSPSDRLVSFEDVHRAPDTVDAGMPLFPRDARRFSLWRDQLKRLTTPQQVPVNAK